MNTKAAFTKVSNSFCQTICAFSLLFLLVTPVYSTSNRAKRAEPPNPIAPIEKWGAGEPVSLAYSDDGSLLAVGTLPGNILIYETQDYKLVQTIETGIRLALAMWYGEGNWYYSTGGVAISGNNQLVALVGIDGSVGVWQIKDAQPKFIHWGNAHGDYIWSTYMPENSVWFAGLRGEILVAQESIGRTTENRFFRNEDGIVQGFFCKSGLSPRKQRATL